MIFISYSWKNRKEIENIEYFLLKYGIEYWLDSNELDLNSCISRQIISALKKSKCLVHFSSKESKNSLWVKYEIATAYKMKKEVITVQIKDKFIKEKLMEYKA